MKALSANAVLLLFFTCVLGLSPSALAQDEATATTGATNQPEPDVIEAKVQTEQPERAEKSPNRVATAPGSYNPSEEISDDLSVSFPVDI